MYLEAPQSALVIFKSLYADHCSCSHVSLAQSHRWPHAGLGLTATFIAQGAINTCCPGYDACRQNSHGQAQSMRNQVSFHLNFLSPCAFPCLVTIVVVPYALSVGRFYGSLSLASLGVYNTLLYVTGGSFLLRSSSLTLFMLLSFHFGSKYLIFPPVVDVVHHIIRSMCVDPSHLIRPDFKGGLCPASPLPSSTSSSEEGGSTLVG